MTLAIIQPGSPDYPAALLRGGPAWTAPVLQGIGNLALLRQPLTALFCSSQCPGNVILRALDLAAEWRDAGRALISGFHSPVEKECLAILLRGASPIVLCPARSLTSFRFPAAWQPALAAGRLLILSAFPAAIRRATAATAHRRNALVAALASEIQILHARPGGKLRTLRE